MSTFTVEQEQRGQAVVMTITGSLGIVGLEDLDRSVTQVAETHPKLVVLDLSGVELIASLAIGSIIKLYNDVRREGGELRLGPMKDNIRGVLKRCRVQDILTIYDSIDEALNAPSPGA